MIYKTISIEKPMTTRTSLTVIIIIRDACFQVKNINYVCYIPMFIICILYVFTRVITLINYTLERRISLPKCIYIFIYCKLKRYIFNTYTVVLIVVLIIHFKNNSRRVFVYLKGVLVIMYTKTYYYY